MGTDIAEEASSETAKAKVAVRMVKLWSLSYRFCRSKLDNILLFLSDAILRWLGDSTEEDLQKDWDA